MAAIFPRPARRGWHLGAVLLVLVAVLIVPTAGRGAAAAPACNQPARTLLRKALALLEAGRWSEVSGGFAKVTATDPGCRADRWDLAPPALDRLTFAYLRAGEDDKAAAIVALGRSASDATGQSFLDAMTLATMPARYALERDAWSEAADLPATASPLPQVAAVTGFARALGAAMAGRPKQAETEIAALRRSAEQLRTQADNAGAEAVDIERAAAEAWAALEAGRRAEALDLMHNAADREDRQNAGNLPNPRLLPMRELLADMLFQTGDATGALHEYETSMAQGPPRLRALWGAAQAAETAGDADKTRLYYAKFAALCQAGSCLRPGRLIAIKRSRTPA